MLNCSKEMVGKLAAVGDYPLLDSVFVKNADGSSAEKTQGALGVYISSEADGWSLHGPFAPAL